MKIKDCECVHVLKITVLSIISFWGNREHVEEEEEKQVEEKEEEERRKMEKEE